MSQCRKTNVVVNVLFQRTYKQLVNVLFQSTFTSCWNDHFLEIDFIAVAEICWNFRSSLSARACTLSSFSQPAKAITREQNVIHFGGYFIYGWYFMERHQADMHISLWIRLIQVGKIHSCFVNLKRYSPLLKLIQRLF